MLFKTSLKPYNPNMEARQTNLIKKEANPMTAGPLQIPQSVPQVPSLEPSHHSSFEKLKSMFGRK